MINKKVNIGIVGLGQIGSRLYREILLKKKDIYIHNWNYSNKIVLTILNLILLYKIF